MKHILFLLLAISFNALADSITVDPNIKPEQIINCTLPTEREDNAPLDVSEILNINWYIGMASGDYMEKIPTETCQITLDLTQYADGKYYIAATTVDTDFRESGYSAESDMTVKRQTPPARMAAPAFVR